MNIFRLAGDLAHIAAIIILFVKILKSRSSAGISGRAQILFCMVFLTRYIDLFTIYVSAYNSTMKVLFIICSLTTVILIYGIHKSTYESQYDTFHIELLIIPAAGLALLVNHEFTPIEILWTFSIYLEAVAILPQMIFISKSLKIDTMMWIYLYVLGSYRTLYLFNWAYRYTHEGHFDLIADFAGIVQTTIFFTFFLFLHYKNSTNNDNKKANDCDSDKTNLIRNCEQAFNECKLGAEKIEPVPVHAAHSQKEKIYIISNI